MLIQIKHGKKIICEELKSISFDEGGHYNPNGQQSGYLRINGHSYEIRPKNEDHFDKVNSEFLKEYTEIVKIWSQGNVSIVSVDIGDIWNNVFKD